MKKRLIGAVCAVMLAGAFPQKSVAGPIKGEFLLKLATSSEERHINNYLMYIAGSVDMFMMTADAIGTKDFFCVSKVTVEDMANAVRIWMRNNKDSLKASGAVVIFSALSKHFPCE